MKLDKRVIMKFLPVIIFFVAIGAVMLFIKFNHKAVDPDTLPKYDEPLSTFEIVSSGDINGGNSILTVKRTNSGAEIYSKSVEKTGCPAKIQQYTVSSEVLDKIEEMFYQNGMIEWSSGEDRKHSSSDSVGYTLTFTFGKDESTFSSSKIPNRNNSLSELFSLVEQYETNDNSAVILKDVFNENGLNIYNLKNGYLDAETVNSETTDKIYSNSVELFKNVDGEWAALTPEFNGELIEFTVPASSQISVQFDLNAFGKLEAGEYKVVFSDVNAEFSIE